MAKSSVTLQTVVNLASTHADLLPLAGVGGYTNEPALSLCNDTLEELLATGQYAWKHNQVWLSAGSGAVGTPYGAFLVTAQNKQDYLFGGATAFTTNGGAALALTTASTPGLTESSFTVTATTLEPHNFNVGDTVYIFGATVAAYNSTLQQLASAWTYMNGWAITATPTTTSFTYTHASSGLANSGAPGIVDYGWLQSATMVEINNNSPLKNVKQLSAYRELPISPRVNNPTKVSVIQDNYDGTISVRFTDVPGGTVWGAALIYQAKAPLKTGFAQFWDPFPDELSFVYRQMFLARCYRYINSPRSEAELQKAEAAIAKGLGLKDAEMSDEYMAPERSFLDF